MWLDWMKDPSSSTPPKKESPNKPSDSSWWGWLDPMKEKVKKDAEKTLDPPKK